MSRFPRLCLRTAYHTFRAIALPLIKPDVRICPHPAFVIGLRCKVSQSRTSPKSLSVRERLARYGSSALSGVEHLRLLVGKDSAVDTLLRHFGSLKELERASFQELRRTQRASAGAGDNQWNRSH